MCTVLYCILHYCTVLLPSGDSPITVNKYIVSYHISYHQFWRDVLKTRNGKFVCVRSGVHEVSKNIKALCVRRVTWSKLQTEDPQTLGATLHNLVAMATWRPWIGYPKLEITLKSVYYRHSLFIVAPWCRSTHICRYWTVASTSARTS
jgi:hypothetical protein